MSRHEAIFEIDNDKVNEIALKITDLLILNKFDEYHCAAALAVMLKELKDKGIEIEIIDFENCTSYQ